MSYKSFKKLVFGVLLLATIFSAGIIIQVEYPDAMGTNISTTQNV